MILTPLPKEEGFFLSKGYPVQTALVDKFALSIITSA